MHMDVGRWRHGRGIYPSVLWKGEQRGWRWLFIIGLGVAKFWGLRRILPEFLYTSPKSFCATFSYKFSPTKIIKTVFWCNLQKRFSCVFLQTLGAIFWSQARLGAIFTRMFRDNAQVFSKSNLLGVRLHRLHPTSNTTAFHNSIIVNFVVYQDRIETNPLQLFEHPENSEWFSIISVSIFEVNVVDQQKKNW